MWRSSSSTRPGRSWPCGRTATTRTTGRCISIPTGSSARRSPRPAIRCPSSTSGCRARRTDLLLAEVSLADPRVSGEDRGGALGHDVALLEDVGAGGDGEGLDDVLLDQEHRDTV